MLKTFIRALAVKLVAEAVNEQMARFGIISQLPTPKFLGGSALALAALTFGANLVRDAG